MSQDTKVYDPTEISMNLCGIIIDSGFAEDTMIKIKQMSDDFTEVIGVDGEVTRSKTNDGRAEVTFMLMQSSSTNALLSVLNNLDKATSNGAGIGPLLIKDRQGTSLYTSPKAWIQRAPDVEFGSKATERAWVIKCAKLLRLDGGN